MPVQGDLCDQLLAKLARLLVVVVTTRVKFVVFPIRRNIPVAHGLLDLRHRVIVALISEEIIASLVGNIDGVFRVGHLEGGMGANGILRFSR